MPFNTRSRAAGEARHTKISMLLFGVHLRNIVWIAVCFSTGRPAESNWRWIWNGALFADRVDANMLG